MQEFINTHNPVLPVSVHVPDCEAHVMSDGKLYLYGSYDDREDAYCSEQYHVVSTPDMEHWTIHDVSLEGRDISWFGDSDAPRWPEAAQGRITPFIRKTYIRGMRDKLLRRLLHPGRRSTAAAASDAQETAQTDGGTPMTLETENPPLLYAPDCICREGRYYLYFCMSDDSEGVAVSDRPEGPFAHPVQLPCSGIDPAVFVDEDGQAYYYWGQFAANGVKLNEDMCSFGREDIVNDLVTEEKHCFHEGSSMRRIGDTYYYVFADMQRGKPTSLGYATGPSPLGPFTYRGILVDNAACDPESWNNHGSIEQFQGQWYVFYHRSSRGGRFHRRLCIEPITIASDGSIAEVPMTSQGAGKPFAPGEVIMGYQACGLKGAVYIGTEETDAGESLQNIANRDEACFRYIESPAPYCRAEVVFRGTGIIELLMDGTLVGKLSCMNAEDHAYHPVSCGITCPPGRYTLTLRFRRPRGLRMKSVTLFC